MFDYLKCEYPLDTPEFLANDKDFSPENLEFQTYSFPPASMDEYEITDDGQLYKWDIERLMKKSDDGFFQIEENKKNLLKQDYTGELLFSALYLSEKFDYFLSYKALFWKGDLKEIDLEEASREDNSHRKEMQETLNCRISKMRDKKNKWWFPFANFFRKIIKFFTFSIRWVLGWKIKVTWKIDRWIDKWTS